MNKQEQWLSARPTRNPVLETMRDTFDAGDPWGSNIAWLFAIADVIYEINPEQVPAEWEFRPSPFGADTESYEYNAICDLIKDEGIDVDVILHAGRVLNRYDNLLRLAGMNY